MSFIIPGGKKILQRMAGKDATTQFWKYHNEGILKKYKPKLQIGSLDTKPAAEPAPAAAPAAPARKPVEITPRTNKPAPPLDVYGDLVPFADPSWYQGVRQTIQIRSQCGS